MRDLLNNPIWQAEELGLPIPDDPHAVSVALPLWQHCVGYEEADPEVLDALQSGYPRFVLHPIVDRLHAQLEADHGQNGERCLAFASALVAKRCLQYLENRQHTGRCLRVADLHAVHAVFCPPDAYETARQYWQHCGEGVCSRQAEAILAGRAPDQQQAVAARLEIQQRLAALYNCPVDHIFLYPNGMAAMAAVDRAVLANRPGCRSVQLGFPYVDVLKVQERCGRGVQLIDGVGPRALTELHELTQQESLCACVVEAPNNPLLSCVNVPELAQIVQAERIPLVIDDTLGGPANIDVTAHADVIFASLTKYFSGTGQVMGGCVVVPPASSHATALREHLQADYEDLLWCEDAELLARLSRDYQERVARINQTTQQLVARLRQHPAVARVRYPDGDDRAAYDLIRRPEGGYGGLFALELKHAAQRAIPVYDALRICKGPSLGTNYSLACPYTILAHYNELEWAEAHGVSRWLLRISIGLEDLDDLWQRFETALSTKQP